MFCLILCYFVLVFFSPFSIAITLLEEERASLGAFRMFVRFALVWFCLFPLPLGVLEGLRFVIVALPGIFFYPFLYIVIKDIERKCSEQEPSLPIVRFEIFAFFNFVVRGITQIRFKGFC